MLKYQETAKNDADFHRKVTARDGYVCQVCGKDFSFDCYFQGDKNQYVCAHHVKSKGAYPELRLKIQNGICVCDHCHKMVHCGQIKITTNDQGMHEVR